MSDAGADSPPAGAGPGGSAAGAGPGGSQPRVLVLASDLIWASRLAAQLRAAGAEPETVRGADGLTARLATGGLAGAVVDLTALAYDGVAAVAEIAGSGLPVLAVGQHDDADLRRRAEAAGAARVLSYRAMFERGPATFAAWLGTPAPARAADSSAPDIPPPPMESAR